MLPAPQCFYALLPWFRLQLVARASKEEEVYSYTDLGAVGFDLWKLGPKGDVAQIHISRSHLTALVRRMPSDRWYICSRIENCKGQGAT